MRATTTFAAILAFATTGLTNPVNVKLDARDPGNFRLYEHHEHQNQCVPGACLPTATDVLNVAVHDDCNGGGCGSKSSNLKHNESYCNTDIQVCGRTLQLVSGGDGDCKALKDLSSANNGQAYATLNEGGKKVGTCSVDFSKSYAKPCGRVGGGVSFQSQVYCAFS